MATIEQLQQRASDFLQQQRPLRPGAAARDGRAAADEPAFELFDPSQLKAAIDLAARLMALANAAEDESALESVLAAAEAESRTRGLALVKYALMVFITHHPRGRQLPIPPLEQREPERIVPSAAGRRAARALGAEAALDWFREDTWVNDHHSKWHVVYPGDGHPNPQNPAQRILRNRQGELFYYMHQQMLARYDTERLALGLPSTQTQPLDHTQPIAEGYVAELPGFSNRAPNMRVADLTLSDGRIYRVQDHTDRRTRLANAASTGTLMRGGAAQAIGDISLLASTIESTIGSIDGARWGDALGFYGSYHNYGHVLIAALRDPNGPSSTRPGVMTSTDTAMRDPVFYRWHRHIDDMVTDWQNRHLPPHSLADAPAGVVLRKGLAGWPVGDSPDVLVCRQGSIPGSAQSGFDGRLFARDTFGAPTWDRPRSAFPVLASELPTRMGSQSITLPSGALVAKPFVDHDDFSYIIRAENTSAQDRPVTVRVFLAAAAVVNDRRMWIEMDKFGMTLPANQRVAIYRPARASSVVRKPAWRPTEPRPVLPPGTPQSARNYCDCGWPYHLLLPRGTRTGMPFRLMVMLTDWAIDRVGADSACGSLSFCGSRDTDYPDSRPMGYPFDRPLAGGRTIEQLLADPGLRHIASTAITVRWV
jgi:tyrosinase